MRLSLRPALGHLVVLLALASPCLAQAQTLSSPPTSHPIYVSAEGASFDDQARDRFRQAAAKLGLGPVETVDLPTPPKPQAPAAVTAGCAKVRELAFDDGRALLLSALAEVNETGA